MRQRAALAVLALSVFLCGCEAFLLVPTAGLAYQYVNSEGRKTYAIPYARVAAAARKAVAALHLRELEVDEDDDRLRFRGEDVNGFAVKVDVYSRDEGRKAEVRSRFGAMGERIPTEVFFSALNEDLGLPLEGPAPRKSGL